jgi:apolipoprotein N-acyltransferase
MATPAARAERAPLVIVADRPRWLPRVLLAIASGLCLSASFPNTDVEPLAWVGLVPLLFAVEGVTPRVAFGLGWLSGLTFYVVTCYWVVYTIVHYTAVPLPLAVGVLLLMSGALGCYTAAFAAGLRWLEDRGLSTIWVAPGLWVTLEWLRGSRFFIGFPWAPLGASQYRYHDLVQMAEVTGVYGVSAFLVLFNVIAAAAFTRRGPDARRLLPALVVLTILAIALPTAGRWRAESVRRRPPAGHLRVAVAQGNVAQDQKWDPAFQGETMARYEGLTRSAASGTPPEVVVWPETATPFFFQEPGPLRESVLDLAAATRVHLLFGSPAYLQDRTGELLESNRAYLVSPDGRELATYDKMQLVPFGEYVPLGPLLFFVDKVVVAIGRMSPGLSPTVFDLPSGRFGTLICYEGIFPALTRRFVAGGADFLVNITNDAWYGRSAAPYQSLAQVTLRAVENRVPVVRAANTGLSAIIDPDGRIRWQSELFETAWHADDISWSGVRTFYSRHGDVFVWLCAGFTLAAFGVGAWRGRRRPRVRGRG